MQIAVLYVIIDVQKLIIESHACSFATNAAKHVCVSHLELMATRKSVRAITTGKFKKEIQSAPNWWCYFNISILFLIMQSIKLHCYNFSRFITIYLCHFWYNKTISKLSLLGIKLFLQFIHHFPFKKSFHFWLCDSVLIRASAAGKR